MIKRGKSVIWAVIALLMLLTSCKDKSSMLVKTWKLQDLKYTREVPKDMQAMIQQSLNELKSNFTLTYNADGTYTSKMKDNVMQGKWKLNWNSTAVTSVTNEGVEKQYSVIELTDNAYSFEAVEGKEKVIFVMIPAK